MTVSISPLVFILFTSILLVLILQPVDAKGSVKSCVRAAAAIEEYGAGDTEESCMACAPTQAYCYPGCQKRIDKLYRACDAICLPDGYFFDPQSKLSGCWGENQPNIKIQTEKCGCNAAAPSASLSKPLLFSLSLIASLLLFLI